MIREHKNRRPAPERATGPLLERMPTQKSIGKLTYLQVHVSQMLGDGTALGFYQWSGENIYSQDVLLKGFPLEGLADGAVLPWREECIIDGTYTYDSVVGPKTVLIMRPVIDSDRPEILPKPIVTNAVSASSKPIEGKDVTITLKNGRVMVGRVKSIKGDVLILRSNTDFSKQATVSRELMTPTSSKTIFGN